MDKKKLDDAKKQIDRLNAKINGELKKISIKK